MTKEISENKRNEAWLNKFSDLSKEEVKEYLDLAEFFILGSRKWIKQKGRWKCISKKLYFKHESGKIVEPKPFVRTQLKNKGGIWVDEVLYKTIAPMDAEEVWLHIAFVLCDIARKKGERLGKHIKPKMEKRKDGELPWNKEAVASPQYKLVSTIGFNTYNKYVQEYEKRQQAGGLTWVEIYGSHQIIKFENFNLTLNFTEDEESGSSDHGDFVYKLIKYNDRVDKIKEFLIADDLSDLDKRLRKMSPQEREATTVNIPRLLNRARTLTPDDQKAGWDFVDAFKFDLSATTMTESNIFEHLRRESCFDKKGKLNNNFKLSLLCNMLQIMGLSKDDFVMLCGWFEGAKIYFPKQDISYISRKRLVEYVTNNRKPELILSLEEICKLEDDNALREQLRMHKRIAKAIKEPDEDERKNEIGVSPYEWIFLRDKGRIRKDRAIDAYNEEVLEQQDKTREILEDKVRGRFALNFATFNKWLASVRQWRKHEDYSEYSQVKKAVALHQNPFEIGRKARKQHQKDKYSGSISTGMTIKQYIDMLDETIERNTRKKEMFDRLRVNQNDDDRILTYIELELVKLELWEEDLMKELDEDIETWRERTKNGKDVTKEVHMKMLNFNQSYQNMRRESELQIEEKQPIFDLGKKILEKCVIKLKKFQGEIGLSPEAK